MNPSNLQLHIVPGDDLPIYRQIMRQITDAVAGGRLGSGDRLPSQRELAEQLVISPLTVKKAYDELERGGLIRTERGRGTFVESSAAAAEPEAQRERLRGSVRRLLQKAYLRGVPFPRLESLLREVHQELEETRRAAAGGRPAASDRTSK